MKRTMFIVLAAFTLASCTTQTPLYTWAKYETTSYNYLKNSDEKSTQELIETYKKIIEKQNGSRGVVPPGIYADYGFLLVQANRTKEGKALLLKEIALYPESKVFIDKILKTIEE